MKALVYDRYGPPSVLAMRDVERPTLDHDDVLVQVRAASVNSWDWDRLTGTPLLTAPSTWPGARERLKGGVARSRRIDQSFRSYSASQHFSPDANRRR